MCLTAHPAHVPSVSSKGGLLEFGAKDIAVKSLNGSHAFIEIMPNVLY